MAGEQPKGRTMRELRAIVAADNERFDALGELWSSLSAVEQQKLVDEAKRMTEFEREISRAKRRRAEIEFLLAALSNSKAKNGEES